MGRRCGTGLSRPVDERAAQLEAAGVSDFEVVTAQVPRVTADAEIFAFSTKRPHGAVDVLVQNTKADVLANATQCMARVYAVGTLGQQIVARNRSSMWPSYGATNVQSKYAWTEMSAQVSARTAGAQYAVSLQCDRVQPGLTPTCSNVNVSAIAYTPGGSVYGDPGNRALRVSTLDDNANYGGYARNATRFASNAWNLSLSDGELLTLAVNVTASTSNNIIALMDSTNGTSTVHTPGNVGLLWWALAETKGSYFYDFTDDPLRFTWGLVAVMLTPANFATAPNGGTTINTTDSWYAFAELR